MDFKHRAAQAAGYLAIFVGCVYSFALVRAIFVGHLVNVWMLVGYALTGSLATYLIYVGRRGLYFAKGELRPQARFGWGRIVVGSFLLFSQANNHLHLYPTRTIVKPLEPSNPTQAAVMEATAVVIAIACVLIIVSGIRKGLARREARSELTRTG